MSDTTRPSAEEHPIAHSFRLYLATAHKKGVGVVFVWIITDASGKVEIASNEKVLLGSAFGDATKGLHPGFLDALSCLPSGAEVEIFDNGPPYFSDQFRYDVEWRRRENYTKKDGKPFADADAMRRVDDAVEARGISVTTPRKDILAKDALLVHVKQWASAAAQQMTGDGAVEH